MALNIPNTSAPPGGFYEGAKSANALSRQMMENQTYMPDMQSQIGYRNALMQGQNIQNQYMPDKLKLANAYQQLQNQFYSPNIQSEIANRNALTNQYNTMTPLKAQQLALENQFYPELTRSQINSQKAMANWRNMGGGGNMSTGSRDDLIYHQKIAQDNPHLTTPEDIRLAANIVAEGGDKMPNGTPINVSQDTRDAYDRAKRSTTTAAVITQGVKANQAEAELKVLDEYAQKGLEPYGDTIFNKSPQQIVDSFKNDDESQQRLGKLIGSQALQFEAAQNRIRLANGQPGVTSTEELMKRSGQMINTNFPMLTYKARKEAARYLDEALKEGLKARRSVGIGASSLQNKKPGKATLRYNPQTGDFEDIK